ncbi:MAG: hypothetical protein ABL890_04310 [Candidatus Peribacteraceae bacterium]
MNRAEAQIIAAKVGTVILNKSSQFGDYKVHDVALFGSAIGDTRKDIRDIDLLLLHNHQGMGDFGLATTYSAEAYGPEIDEDKKAEPFEARRILQNLGSLDVTGDLDKLEFEERQPLEDYRRKLTYAHGRMVEMDDGRSFTTKELEQAIEQRENEFREKYASLRQHLVVTRVAAIMENHRFTLDDLDIQAMHIEMLGEDCRDERRVAVKQSKDPRFWGDVFSSGLLLNPETGTFDRKIEEKYTGATALFRQAEIDAASKG